MSTDLREDIETTFERFLSGVCDPGLVREVEARGNARTLWERLEECGFLDALVGEEQGGSALSLADTMAIPLLCGRFCLPAPMTETMLLRGLFARAGAAIPDGPLTLARGMPSPAGGIACQEVLHGRIADWIVVEAQGKTLLLAGNAAALQPASFALDAGLDWPAAAVAAATRIDIKVSIEVAQAFICAAQLSGAMAAVLERSLTYANERQQFGRPIGKFQAIQHQLALMAEQAYAARMAVELCADGGLDLDPLRTAIAKARASEAAVTVSAMAHAIHGAIGFTEEYDLQLLIRRMHAWRRSAGTEAYWHARIGAALVADQHTRGLDFLRKISDAR